MDYMINFNILNDVNQWLISKCNLKFAGKFGSTQVVNYDIINWFTDGKYKNMLKILMQR